VLIGGFPKSDISVAGRVVVFDGGLLLREVHFLN